MKRLYVVFLFTLLASSLYSQDYLADFLENYGAIAQEEMDRTGIPASIKLGQGLLESNLGRSELAIYANNHFGIKCGNNWTGRTYYKEDDDRDHRGKLIESCFRVFDTSQDSYRAHSEFLLSNARYQALFDLRSDDYKGWARGLKKCGYATDPKYATKLIAVIEKYELFQFDQGQNPVAINEKRKTHTTNATNKSASNNDKPKKQSKSNKRTSFFQDFDQLIRDIDSGANRLAVLFNEDPLENIDLSFDGLFGKNKAKDQTKNEKPSQENKEINNSESAKPSKSPLIKQVNGVHVHVVKKNETLSSIAGQYNISLYELNALNESAYDADKVLRKGALVYLQEKKLEYTGRTRSHLISKSETILNVAQRYGVTEESIRKRNYLEATEEVKPGEIIYLRGKRKSKKPATLNSSAGVIFFK